MILKEPATGRYVALRSAHEADAAFILKLRLDPELNEFLHPTDPSLGRQQTWLAEKKRQSNDCHLIIETLQQEACGTIAVYDIDFARGTFEWGRWVVARSAPIGAAWESSILIYDLAFNSLGLKTAFFGVRKGNRNVVAFHERYAPERIREDEEAVYFCLKKENYSKTRMYETFFKRS